MLENDLVEAIVGLPTDMFYNTGILDVLQNYTPYSLAFKLAHEGREIDDEEVERSAAPKKIMGWVRLHPYNIAQKVQVVVEHFRTNVAALLGGKAKAMVVTASRVEAVRWKIAIDKYIDERGYKIGTLVAFSGEVIDKESGPDPFSEGSRSLNPDLKGRNIRDAFKGGEYHVLLVANKFQTGFDQPLLCGMYVDRRLAGIQAVQTLYVNDVLKGKLLESTTLAQQAANNTKEQFANSPDLQAEIMNAIMGALDAHTLMSTQALNSEAVRGGIKDILLNHARLWEELRSKAGVAP